MPMEYVVPSLKIVALTEMTDVETVNERLLHLLGLEEDHFRFSLASTESKRKSMA